MTSNLARLARRALAVVAVGGVAISLTACSGGTPTATADDIAELASDALEEEVGQRPDAMDCGSEDVEIVEGNTVDCTLTAGADELDAVVTVTEVDGSDYRITVEVAEA